MMTETLIDVVKQIGADVKSIRNALQAKVDKTESDEYVTKKELQDLLINGDEVRY